jgi:hypothetical protein
VNTGTTAPTNNVYYTVALNSSSGYTFSFWVNFNYGGVYAQVMLAILNSGNAVSSQIYIIQNNQLQCFGSGLASAILASPNLTTGSWYHVALSVTTSTRILYLNGVGFTGEGTTGNQVGFVLGGSPTTYSAWCSYDDLRVYNSALSSSQIQTIYNQQGMPGRGVASNDAYITSGLVAYYDTQNLRYPNSVSGTTWYDISGNGRSVTIRPGSSYNSAGKYITFDGTINSGTTVAQSGQSLTRWTVMCAFMQTANGTSFARVAGSSPAYDAGEIALYGQALAFNPPENSAWTTTSFTTTYNVWSHKCVAFDTTTTGVVDAWVYINGALVNSYTIDGTVETLTGYTIGARNDFNNEAMIGRMSLFAIYNRVLSQSEVSANYEFYKKTQIPTYLPVQLTGTPLFTQLSPSATSSAVGAFSLRAVNGVTAKAVNVVPGGTFPPSAMTQTGTNLSTQTLGTGKLNGSYIASSSTSAFGGGASGAFGLRSDNPYIWQVNSYPVGGGTVSTPTTTTTGATNYNGEWLQFQTPFPINLTGYSAGTDFLTSVVLLASTTGATSSWILVDSKSAITVGSTITNTGLNFAGYSYFRFVVITSTINYPLLRNVRFFGTVPSLAQDFYADERGNLLTAPVVGTTLQNWLGGATGYVTKWYDQSGRGNDAIQNTAANQPIIQRATKGPGYACVYTGNQWVSFGTLNTFTGTPFCISAVTTRTSNVANNGIIGWGTTTSGFTFSIEPLSATQDRFRPDFRKTTGLGNSGNIPVYTAGEGVLYPVCDYSSGFINRIYNKSSLLATSGNGVDFLNTAITNTPSIGLSNARAPSNYYKGEIYELLVFTQSLYDLDTTGGLITQIYQNQLSYTGT